MPASRLHCWECGAAFQGRADARYCSNACRQKAHRTRAVRRAAEKSVAATRLDSVITDAQRTRQLSRTIRGRARAAIEAAAQTLENVGRSAP